MSVQEINDLEVIRRGYKALIDELGIVGFIRFVRLTRGGKGNWTEEREEFRKRFEGKSAEEIAKIVKAIVRNSYQEEQNRKV